MGNWTRYEFGRDLLPERCYLFAGDTPQEQVNKILSYYEKIEFHKHTVYERYIVSNGAAEDLLIFQVYGAPVITDLSFILKDGGVKEIIFIGLAYGFKNGLKIGSYVIPNIVQASEGLLKQIFNVDYSSPNKEIVRKIKEIFDVKKINYNEGKTISVPCTFFHLDYKKFDADVIAAEMEFSSVCYISEKIGLKCGGILIISDNEDHSLLDDRTEFYRRWAECFKIVKESLE